MKKKFLYLIILFAFLSSCKKTTKAKVINDWKVESFNMLDTKVDAFGTNKSRMNLQNSNYFRSDDYYNGIDSQENGTMTYYKLKIKKYGTWSMEKELIYTTSLNPVTQKWIQKESGTWSFIGKTRGDDFKKNERIIFNTLEQKSIISEIDQPNSEKITESTFWTGQNSTIYTIIESTNKKLKLSLAQDSKTILANGQTLTTITRKNFSLIPD